MMRSRSRALVAAMASLTVLLLAGYGPLSGLVPWQGWGIAASIRGAAVFSALCLGLLPAMALPMLWRVGRVADAAAESLPLGGLLAAAGC